MNDDGERSPLWMRIVIALGLTILPIILVVGTGMTLATDRPETWQLALRLTLFVVGGSLAVIIVLILNDRAERRGETRPAVNTWVKLAVLICVLFAAYLFGVRGGD